jgi:ActR/RegA family two-component response regulator
MSEVKTRHGRGRLLALRVLIAEDSWLFADTLAVLLEEEGAYVLGPFGTVGKALDCLHSETVDFAIVDLNLGDAFADRLVDSLVARQVPHAIVTGFQALPTNADRAAVATLRKPCDTRELIDLLSRFAKTQSGV